MEYPTINVDAENEHFLLSDSIISWMESCKTRESQRTSTDDDVEAISNILPSPLAGHHLSASGVAWNMVRIFCKNQGTSFEDCLPKFALNDALANPSTCSTTTTIFQQNQQLYCHISDQKLSPSSKSQQSSPEILYSNAQDISPKLVDQLLTPCSTTAIQNHDPSSVSNQVRMRGNDEWAPPRAQIIFNIHVETNFRKSMQRQNYLCAGCGTKIDLELARRLVLFCHYLGKYFCKCCFSHRAIHLPSYIVQRWDFHKYPVSQFALQLVDKIANEPLFNIQDINPNLYKRVKKLKHLIDIRMQLYYLKIYITTCPQTDKLRGEYSCFTHQHLLQDDIHLYSLNNLIEIQHGKLYEYLNDLVARSIAHTAQCDRCRAKGHYCQLCGPSSLMSSMIMSSGGESHQSSQQHSIRLKHSNSLGQNVSNISGSAVLANNVSTHPISINSQLTNNLVINTNDHQLIFPFEIGRVAQCRGCGCCFHLQCFIDAGQNCPKCERIQRRKAETMTTTTTTTTTMTSTSTTTSTATGTVMTSGSESSDGCALADSTSIRAVN